MTDKFNFILTRLIIMVDEEQQKELINKAKEIFGITDNCNRVGYILPDGEMLDFGNPDRKEGGRYREHSDIWEAYSHFPEIKTIERNGYCFFNYIDQWLKETGSIRLSGTTGNSIIAGEMFQPNTPTRKQLETLEYCSCLELPEKILMEFSKCNNEGRHIPKNFSERVSHDCVEPINDLNKKIKEWKREKIRS